MNLPRYQHPWRPLDGSGRPYPHAKLYFYQPGTTTRREVYADDNFVQAYTQPLRSDGGGYFPVFYVHRELRYKVILKDKDGAQIWTADDTIPADITS